MTAVSNSSADLCQKENANSNSLYSISNGSLDYPMTPVKRVRRQSENLSRRNSTRRSRDSRISTGEVSEAVTLFEVISIGKRAIQSVVDDWIKAYQEDRDAALLDLITFYIQCSGCQGVVTAELFQNPNNRNIMQKLTEEFDEETGLQFKKFMAYPWILTITWPVNLDSEDYPLIRPGIYWKKFRSNFCEFTSVLVQQCQYSVIYDGYLLNTLISLLLGLSDSCVRAFRHTSTLSAVKLLTALIGVILNLDINIDNADRLYEVEKKRDHLKKINPRLEQLDKKRKKLQQRHREIEDMMDALLKGTFLQRYRDVVFEIRSLCIEEIGMWMKMYPHVYLTDSYLKYVGWMLHDKVPDVRLKSLISLHGVYEKTNLVSKMDLFTIRFKDRIISMTLDKDHEVSVQSMKLLVHMLRNCEDVFTTEDCETLYQFVFASHRPLAAAAGEFLYIRLLCPMTEAISTQKTENAEHKIGQLLKLLDFFLECKLHDHVTYLVDSLWDCTPGFLKDWKCMTSILLQDSSEKRLGLSTMQENLLVELMLATVRQSVECHPPVGRGAAKKVLSAKEKKAQLEDKERITEHFAETLPLMLAKFSTNPDKVINLLQIPRYFDKDIYFEAPMEKHVEALMTQMKSIAVSHSDPEVLEACSKTYSSLSNDNQTSQNCQVSLSRKELIKHLVDTYSQMLDDVLQEGEEQMTAEDVHPMSCTLRRLAAFHNAHNLSEWDLYQKTSELLTFDVQRQRLPAELMLSALQCMYYAILWQILPIIEDLPTQEELGFCTTRVKQFCQLCRKYLGHKDPSIGEQAFLSLCDLLMLLQYRGARMLDCVDSALETELLTFVRQHVFQGKEEKDAVVPETNEDMTLVILHRKRMLLAVYCKLIASSVVEMSAVAEIYKQYMKTYNDFGDIIKETLSRTRQNNRIECAKTLVLCLKQLFLEHREAHDSATQSSSSFSNIKELARRFSLTFGMDHVKCRESIAMMHKQGIEFAFKEPATQDSVPPPNLPFLMLISEFSSKLLRADKRLVYGYLQRFASEQMMLCKGAGWHPLIVYSNSLLDNHDEESSSCGSLFSRDRGIFSTPYLLKRKSMYEHVPGRSLANKRVFDDLESHYPAKSKKQNALHMLSSESTVSFNSDRISINLKSQNMLVDENNEDVDVDEIETDQVAKMEVEEKDLKIDSST
ncbi:LOW QUALITY PROTEIN: cohesin subunit SA-2-like [Anomaloglossus baeobatrachus]|uniref:LOW QUALITY PROTEIN: cohesin subunit SA-2-like n=1 Tax=Anomaloglossus baeobatrachus TaxID=238106 RepID=UPI003F505F5B